MNVSNYLAIALLNQVFRNTNYTRPTTLYIALYTSNPTAADTGQEVTGGAYARQAVVFTPPAAVNGVYTIKNSAEIPYPVATATWGQLTHLGIRDAVTDGNLLYYGALTDPKSILTNDIFKFSVGQVSIDLS
ncbi:hypothetical protein [Paenibacillus sp. FSL F4-0097]|uniref:phage tail fiber protein n=1 Tax=Paenibacillus sp. FSL F4-0097 TaxID=2921369 RepID=UPI003158351B